MLGIIVQLLISWLIIWLIEKGNLGFLGFYPTRKRLSGFAIFFIVTALCCSSDFFMRMIFAEQQWELNPKLNANTILTGTWWNIKSVLFEEFIFRGVLFYILIKKLGHTKAIIISAIAFGVYHWFSHGVIGNPVQMLITFLITGTMGLVYAYAYSKTFSLYYPIAIHLGWNLTGSVIFSSGNIGNQLFTQVQPVPEVQVGYFVFFSIRFVPMLSAMLINWLMLMQMKQEAIPHPRYHRNQ
ncbi:MAG: CPBP family intramembrane metalloprotease [Ferruginibacter sp.]|nr:CPBP family intramembrane metalloprotease [Ferruginibacter sp.]